MERRIEKIVERRHADKDLMRVYIARFDQDLHEYQNKLRAEAKKAAYNQEMIKSIFKL